MESNTLLQMKFKKIKMNSNNKKFLKPLKIYLINLILFACLVMYYILLISLQITINNVFKVINLIIGISALLFGLFTFIYFLILLIKKDKHYKIEINYLINTLFLIIMGVLFIIYQ